MARDLKGGLDARLRKYFDEAKESLFDDFVISLLLQLSEDATVSRKTFEEAEKKLQKQWKLLEINVCVSV